MHAPGSSLSGLVVGFRGIGLENVQNDEQDLGQTRQQVVANERILIEDLTDEELAEVLERRRMRSADQMSDRMG